MRLRTSSRSSTRKSRKQSRNRFRFRPLLQELEDRRVMHAGLLATVEDARVFEGDQTTYAIIPVTLNHAESSPVTVNYMTEAITAKLGVDYEPVEGTLTFAPGVTVLSVTIPIVGDTLDEEDERFQFHIECNEVACNGHAHISPLSIMMRCPSFRPPTH
jgi:hypothetical protein